VWVSRVGSESLSELCLRGPGLSLKREQADLADYRRAVEEFYLEYRDQMDEETREKFRQYLEEPHN
jgi:hypothetical protein